MKTNLKKLFGVLLITFILMCAMAVSASALAESGQCGDNVYWIFNNNTGELIISGEGPMWNYTSADAYYRSLSPFYYNSEIKTLDIKEGITTIGDYIFYDIDTLEDYTIPDSITTIGAGAFGDCDGITNVTIPNTISTIGKEAFIHCSNITSINIPESVTAIGEEAFYRCRYLTSATIPNASIGELAFGECWALKNIYIGKGVTEIDDLAFYECTALTSIFIPDNVRNIGNCAFWKCSNIETATIEGGYIEANAFENCEKLKTLTLGNSISGIGTYAFLECTKLTNVTMGSGAILDYAFYGCLNLKNIILKSGKIYDYAFYNCPNLKNVTIGTGVTKIEEYAFYNTPVKTIHYLGAKENFNIIGNTFENIAKHYDCSYEEEIEATCTENAYRDGVFCTTCGWVCRELVEIAKGHCFINYISDNNATCTKNGTMTSKCNNCNEIDIQIEYSKGHNFTNYISNNDATCTADGTKTATCDRCTATDTKVDYNTAKGHTYSNYISDNNATCIKDGTKTAKCDNNCGLTDTVTDYGSATGHSYEDVIYNPTCTENGYIEYTCHCGRHYTETIEATGHDFEGSKCKNCPFDKATECSCNCHAGGIKTFFFSIINFFQKLFGQNKLCACGANH